MTDVVTWSPPTSEVDSRSARTSLAEPTDSSSGSSTRTGQSIERPRASAKRVRFDDTISDISTLTTNSSNVGSPAAQRGSSATKAKDRSSIWRRFARRRSLEGELPAFHEPDRPRSALGRGADHNPHSITSIPPHSAAADLASSAAASLIPTPSAAATLPRRSISVTQAIARRAGRPWGHGAAHRTDRQAAASPLWADNMGFAGKGDWDDLLS